MRRLRLEEHGDLLKRLGEAGPAADLVIAMLVEGDRQELLNEWRGYLKRAIEWRDRPALKPGTHGWDYALRYPDREQKSRERDKQAVAMYEDFIRVMAERPLAWWIAWIRGDFEK